MSVRGEKRPTRPTRLEEKLRDPEFRLAYEAERRRLGMSETLLSLLDELGISQVELARRLKVSPSTVSHLLSEGHLPRMDSLMRVLDALNARMEVRFEARTTGTEESKRVTKTFSCGPLEAPSHG